MEWLSEVAVPLLAKLAQPETLKMFSLSHVSRQQFVYTDLLER